MHVRTDYTPKYTYIFTFIELLIYVPTMYISLFHVKFQTETIIFHFLPSETVPISFAYT